MSDELTYVLKPRDPAEIIRLEDATALEQFLEQPLPAIAEAITGALAAGKSGVALAAGRIVQGALKGKLFEQFARELQELRRKGKIPDDFAGRKYGYQTWVELLGIIDSDVPDEDRLEALKAMFFSVNRTTAGDADRILGYQLFQVAKRLTSGQLLVLKAVYEAYRSGEPLHGTPASYNEWTGVVAKRIGHNTVGLIQREDRILVDEGLLTERTWSDRSGVNANNFRLTDLGILFCQNIENYRLEIQQKSSANPQE